MHYYKKNIGDYHKKAGRLTMLQHGAYTLLMDAIYDREQFPTKAEAIDWAWASSREEVEAVEFVLKKFFTQGGGIYKQKRVQEELNAFHTRSEINTRIAIERETKRLDKLANRTRSAHESPPNHKPLTTNHKPKDQKTRVRFTPPTLEEVEKFNKEKPLGIDAVSFVSFYQSKNWMVGKNKMKDWKAAAVGWATRDKLNGKAKPAASDHRQWDASGNQTHDNQGNRL